MDSAAPSPDQRERATGCESKFLRMTGGVSLIRYWGVSDVFASSVQPFGRVPASAADEPMSRERVTQSTPMPSRSVEPVRPYATSSRA
jgi:hypothetical protein